MRMAAYWRGGSVKFPLYRLCAGNRALRIAGGSSPTFLVDLYGAL
jgi:hypothetical protein